MWEEILRMAAGNGLWATLFCALLLYQLKDGRRRESKYQQIIDGLADRLGTVKRIETVTSETLEEVRRLAKKEPRRRNERKEDGQAYAV